MATLNRFAQLLYGKVIFIYETTLPMEQLSTIFSPSTYWVDVTDKQCNVGDIVTYDTNTNSLVFTAPTDTAEQTPTLEERITTLEDTVNALLGEDTTTNTEGGDVTNG